MIEPTDPEATEGVAALSTRQGIQSVEIAMTVLEAIEHGLGPMTLSQVAAGCGMAPSKAHRYLVSLRRAGLIARSPVTGLYDLGPAMRRLGAEALRRMDEVSAASEYLPGLRDRTQQSVNLSVWGESGPVIVRWEYGAHVLPITVRVGATLPLLPSSAGRVFLAVLPESLTAVVLAQHDAATRPGPEELAALREEVTRTGVSVTFDGVIPGVTTLAAPVWSTGSSIPLVVALTLPSAVCTQALLDSVTTELLVTTRAMTADLGGRAETGTSAVGVSPLEPDPPRMIQGC